MSLTRRSELRRSTPLPRPAARMRRTPLARVSPRRRAQAAQRAAVWDQVQRRDRHCLLAYLDSAAGPCCGRLTPHHLQKAGQGGPFTVLNIVVLCAGHNDWVEDHPRPARALGLVVRAGETVALAWQRMRDRGLITGGPA